MAEQGHVVYARRSTGRRTAPCATRVARPPSSSSTIPAAAGTTRVPELPVGPRRGRSKRRRLRRVRRVPRRGDGLGRRPSATVSGRAPQRGRAASGYSLRTTALPLLALASPAAPRPPHRRRVGVAFACWARAAVSSCVGQAARQRPARGLDLDHGRCSSSAPARCCSPSASSRSTSASRSTWPWASRSISSSGTPTRPAGASTACPAVPMSTPDRLAHSEGRRGAGGLLGSSVVARSSASTAPGCGSPAVPVTWATDRTADDVAVRDLRGFLAAARGNGPWQVAWCAGVPRGRPRPTTRRWPARLDVFVCPRH